MARETRLGVLALMPKQRRSLSIQRTSSPSQSQGLRSRIAAFRLFGKQSNTESRKKVAQLPQYVSFIGNRQDACATFYSLLRLWPVLPTFNAPLAQPCPSKPQRHSRKRKSAPRSRACRGPRSVGRSGDLYFCHLAMKIFESLLFPPIPKRVRYGSCYPWPKSENRTASIC